jgi:hypothetical protein
MVNTINKRNARPYTSSLIFPINKTAILMCEDAEPLPSMFRRSQMKAEAEPCRSNGRARFSPYIILLVLFAFAPAQAALLRASCPIDGAAAIEELVQFAKQGAAKIAGVLAPPAAAKQNDNSAGHLH